ncbi:heavy metal-associated domain, HMA [Artemisia annua]|uniref:Heavy metal-associated domain, HMA n=1 Tax=Artemisia annua TaxID=35608 RepID=A0A2U1M3Y6_ARTAN|nr:heavy metal-associated domain, HMA [Artemisia annua]
MAKDEDFKLLKIKTCTLRVNMHYDGCKHKVKKVLQRIEGKQYITEDVKLVPWASIQTYNINLFMHMEDCQRFVCLWLRV